MVIKESTMWKHIVCCCSYAAFASSVKYVIFAIPFGADSGTEITHHTFGLIIPLCSFLFAPKHLWKWSSLLMGIRCFAKNCLLLFYFIFNSYYFLFQFNQTILFFIFFLLLHFMTPIHMCSSIHFRFDEMMNTCWLY